MPPTLENTIDKMFLVSLPQEFQANFLVQFLLPFSLLGYISLTP